MQSFTCSNLKKRLLTQKMRSDTKLFYYHVSVPILSWPDQTTLLGPFYLLLIYLEFGRRTKKKNSLILGIKNFHIFLAK
jgi:hypothetical protein